MADNLRAPVVGVGNMGLSHAKAYRALDGFEIAGLEKRQVGELWRRPVGTAKGPRQWRT